MAKDVIARTASASMVLLGARIFVKTVDLVLILILARILVPEDFALVAMAMIFIQFTEAILLIPVIQALIRTPTVTDSMLDTAFTISFLRALILTCLVIAFVPVATHVFNEPRLGALMVFLAMSPALRGLVNPRLVMYARKINYFPEAMIDTIAKVVTASVAIPLAIYTQSYWSLAIMTVLSPVTVIIGSYIYAPYRPRLTLKDWPVFSNMIGWATVAQIFSAANWQIDIFVLGQNVPKDTIGQYSMSQTLSGAPQQVLVIPIIAPFIAAFAELRTPAAIREGYLTASSVVVTGVAPVLALMVAFAGPIVALLFNDSWAGATIFMTVLPLVGMLALPTQPLPSVSLALDRTVFNALHTFVGFAVKAPILILGLKYYGINGFLIGQILGVTASTIAGILIMRHLVQLSVWSQIVAMARPVAGLAALFLVAYLLQPFINYANSLTLALTMAGAGAAAFLAYVGTVYKLWDWAGRPEGLEQMLDDGARKVMRRFVPSTDQ